MATVLVAFANVDGSPTQMSAGKEMRVPPPATEFIAPATKAARKTTKKLTTKAVPSFAQKRGGCRRFHENRGDGNSRCQTNREHRDEGPHGCEEECVGRQQHSYEDVGKQSYPMRASQLTDQMRPVHDVGEHQMAAHDPPDGGRDAHQHEHPQRNRLAEPFLDLPRVRGPNRVEKNRDDLMRAPPRASPWRLARCHRRMIERPQQIRSRG